MGDVHLLGTIIYTFPISAPPVNYLFIIQS